MEKTYVEQHDEGYWVAGTRISLDSVVYPFRRGASPENIRSSYPSLTLEQVYGSIAYYRSIKNVIDDYLNQSEIEYEAARLANHEQFRREKPELYDRLMKAKALLTSARLL